MKVRLSFTGFLTFILLEQQNLPKVPGTTRGHSEPFCTHGVDSE